MAELDAPSRGVDLTSDADGAAAASPEAAVETVGDGLPDRLEVSPEEVLARFKGAAVLLDRRGRVTASNEEGQELAGIFGRDGEPRVRGLVAAAIAEGRAVSDKVEVPNDEGNSALEVMFMPLDSGGGERFVMVLSREFTVERNFMNALLTSRQLFKDLVSCSADFAWETDRSGNCWATPPMNSTADRRASSFIPITTKANRSPSIVIRRWLTPKFGCATPTAPPLAS